MIYSYINCLAVIARIQNNNPVAKNFWNGFQKKAKKYGKKFIINYDNKKNALIWASSYGLIECVRLLLQHRENNVNHVIIGWSALMFAADEGHADIIQLLLEQQNTDINQTDEDEYTALMMAADKGNADCIKLLLHHRDINVDHVDKFGRTALMLAANKGHTDIVNMIKEYQCEKNNGIIRLISEGNSYVPDEIINIISSFLQGKKK